MSVLSQLVEYNHTSVLGRSTSNGFSLITDLLGGEAVDSSIDIKDLNRNVALAPKGTGIIDIVNDFPWNANYLNASYGKIPKVFITEREQQESSMVSMYYYYISNILNQGSRITTSGNVAASIDYIKTATQKFIDRAAQGMDGVTSNIQMPDGLGENINSGVDKFVKFIQAVGSDFATLAAADAALLGDYLKSYTGIYLTRETGFNYVIPYFEDNFYNIQNSWMPIGSSMSSVALDVVDGLAESFLQFTKPGVYIERPQYFNFQQSGDSFTVRFPLLNTVGVTYKKNYELLWILAFQNKYYRESFAAVRPPKIYTVTIPGSKFLPYAYIENLTVDFAGTKRLLEVETPAGTVQAPIPDAYMVSITFRSLISDTANSMLTNQFHRNIITGVR